MSEERYSVLKLLGKGRTGGVYEAEDSRLGRKVAMRRFYSQNEFTDTADYEKEFKRIAQNLSALQHPNLLSVFDAGVDEDGPFIISQLLSGTSLQDRLKEGPLSNWDVWDLGRQLSDALSASHAGGFTHGAITPGSIVMSPRARGGYLYVILDMGLSRLAPLIQGKDSIFSMMADPAILAPESFEEHTPSKKSDLYMLGNILYMCLAGGHPFGSKSIDECHELHLAGLPPLTDFAPDAPQDLVDWIAWLCAVNPEDRPASVVEALEKLPEVERPAQTGLTSMQTVGAMVSTGPTAPVTSYTRNLSGLSGSQVSQAPKASSGLSALAKKCLVGAGVVVLGLVLFIIFGGDSRTGEEIAADKAKTSSEASVTEKFEVESSEETDVYYEKPIVYEELHAFKVVDGERFAENWSYHYNNKHELLSDGWKIMGEANKTPGVSKILGGEDFEKMYSQGWDLKYETIADDGVHYVGLYVSGSENKYWQTKGEDIGILLKVDKRGNQLYLSRDGLGETEVDLGDSDYAKIELRSKRNDSSGRYRLVVNEQVILDFDGKMSQSAIFPTRFMNQLFVATGRDVAGDEIAEDTMWSIQEICLCIEK